MAHLQYMPGDPRLVDQLVYELKSKGIFDQFRKECIADVDTKPAYQNLRQRVESSVSTFLARQKWKPDLNKNQLREKLRKHILDGNYLEQGLERIVDQVVNPKIASVFIPQVEDLVYNYLGIPRKKAAVETEIEDKDSPLLPKDLEAVSPGSVNEENGDMVIDENSKLQNNDSSSVMDVDQQDNHNTVNVANTNEMIHIFDVSIEKNSIPLPTDDIQISIPIPENSPPNSDPMLEGIMLPKDQIPLPKEMPPENEERYFKSLDLLSNDDSTTSDSSINRNMSPLTPIRNFDEDNSCDAQQGFENNDNDNKYQVNSFKFSIERKSPENSQDGVVPIEKKDLTQQFQTAVNIPLFSESSNSNNLQIDYESDANTKVSEKTEDTTDRKEKEKDRKSSHKSSHNSRDKQKHSSSKDRKESKDSKHSSSRDKDKDRKKDDKKSSHRDKSRDRSEKKESKDSKDSKDKHRSSSHKSSSHSSSSKHRSSSSSKDEKQRHSSKDEKKPKSSSEKERKDHRSSSTSSKSQRSDKDRKSSRSKDDKDKDRKDKKKGDDHYSASGRNNHGRRSTDRDSNDGNSTSSKGSNAQQISKTTDSKTENKSSSKSGNTSSGSGSTSPSDKDNNNKENITETKPMSAIRIETHLNTPVMKSPMRMMPEVILKKPKFANNFEEAKKLMKMRKFMDEEQKRMNQEAALLLEFQANVRPSLSQVYSSIPGPELEFVCMKSPVKQEEKYDELQSLQQEINKPVADNDDLDEEAESQLVICEEVIESKEDIKVTKKIELKEETFDQDDTLIETELKTNETLIHKKEKSRVKSELNIQDAKGTENIATKVLSDYFEVTVTADDASSTDDCKSTKDVDFELLIDEQLATKATENPLRYFNQQEIYDSEIELDRYKAHYEKFKQNTPTTQRKLFLINCLSFHKKIFKSMTKNKYEIVCYNRNGQMKTKEAKIIKNIDKEISIPETTHSFTHYSPISSPVKTDFSFDLSSDYESKLDDMVKTTSRQQIMEIILGGELTEGSPGKIVMPQIDICQKTSIDFESLKRKMEESDNNNDVLSANKIRRISESEQISSTTEDESHTPNYSLKVAGARSKYLGKARRIGLPKPKRTVVPVQPNSPSSDKSVENYVQNDKTDPEKINGKIKSTPRTKVQRYDTTDLYKPKLHFLSRRNNVT